MGLRFFYRFVFGGANAPHTITMSEDEVKVDGADEATDADTDTEGTDESTDSTESDGEEAATE